MIRKHDDYCNYFKRFVIASFIFIFALYNSCIMMPFTIGSMLFNGNRDTENSDMIDAVNKLVQKSADALMDNRGPYEQILLGKTETDGCSTLHQEWVRV